MDVITQDQPKNKPQGIVTPPENRFRLPIVVLLVIVVLLALNFWAINYFFNKNQKTQLAKGIEETQQMATAYPKLVKQAIIQQPILGTVKAVTEKSITLQKDEQVVTLIIDSPNTIRYSKLDKASASAQLVVPVKIASTDLKVGNFVSVNRLIDWKTGKASVVSITVMPPQ